MENIVIRTDQAERAVELVSLLNSIFPECEVQVVVETETLVTQDLPDGSQNGFKEDECGKYFCY